MIPIHPQTPQSKSAGGNAMNRKSLPNSASRRNFITTTGGLLAAAVAVPRAASALAGAGAAASTPASLAEGTRKIPIGVFDPVFSNLSLDAMIEKVSGMGLEAVEIGTGGYPGAPHCPVQE